VAGALGLVVADAGRANPRRRLAQAGVGAGVAAVLLAALGQYARTPTPAEAHDEATVRSLWEPRQGIPDAHRRL
jgi:hypothetical protein